MIPLWLLGMGAGALLDKKKPLRGALLGGGGGYFAPALFGASGGAGLLGNAAATNPALIESAVGTAGYGASSASPGLLGSLMQYAKPAGEALGAASAAQSLFGQPQQQMAPPAQLGATGDPIGQMLSSQQQEEQMRRQMMEELRRRIYGAP